MHAVSVRDTLAAIEAKPDLLVHTPHIGNLGDDPAAVKKIVDAKIPMTSTLAVFVPHFDAQRHRRCSGIGSRSRGTRCRARARAP